MPKDSEDHGLSCNIVLCLGVQPSGIGYVIAAHACKDFTEVDIPTNSDGLCLTCTRLARPDRATKTGNTKYVFTAQETLKGGGGTFDSKSGHWADVKGSIMVGGIVENGIHPITITDAQLADEIAAFVKEYEYEFSLPNRYLGLWIDEYEATGEKCFFIDCSEKHDDLLKAECTALIRNERAVYHIDDMDTIYTAPMARAIRRANKVRELKRNPPRVVKKPSRIPVKVTKKAVGKKVL